MACYVLWLWLCLWYRDGYGIAYMYASYVWLRLFYNCVWKSLYLKLCPEVLHYWLYLWCIHFSLRMWAWNTGREYFGSISLTQISDIKGVHFNSSSEIQVDINSNYTQRFDEHHDEEGDCQHCNLQVKQRGSIPLVDFHKVLIFPDNFIVCILKPFKKARASIVLYPLKKRATTELKPFIISFLANLYLRVKWLKSTMDAVPSPPVCLIANSCHRKRWTGGADG